MGPVWVVDIRRLPLPLPENMPISEPVTACPFPPSSSDSLSERSTEEARVEGTWPTIRDTRAISFCIWLTVLDGDDGSCRRWEDDG